MNFAPGEFFELEGFACSDLFDGVETIWKILGRPLAEYIAAKLKPEVLGTVMDGAHLMGDNIYIGKGTIVEPGAMIKGPAIIGRNCEIRHTAYIREDVIVGDNCIVGHASELKGCVLLNHVEAGHFAYIGDSVVGNHAMLGAGVRLANFKVDATEVVVYDGGERHHTGLDKFGAIAGDGCKFGCNSVSNPGTVLGKGCIIMPCTTVRGCVLPGTIIRGLA